MIVCSTPGCLGCQTSVGCSCQRNGIVYTPPFVPSAADQFYSSEIESLRSSLKEIREENDRLRKHMRYTVPMHADGNYVFIDGPGDVELDHGGEMRARIEQLEKENDRLKGERDEAQSDHLKALADLAEAKGESSLFSADAKTAWAECVELREENKSLSELLTAAVDDYNNALASCEAMAKALEQSREAHMLLIDPKHIIGSSVLDALAKVTAAEVTARAALDAYRKEKGE